MINSSNIAPELKKIALFAVRVVIVTSAVYLALRFALVEDDALFRRLAWLFRK
ncbi:hypothetical protein MXMO3_03544 (plasmid) [Maritalea myrionectae]|uniref:Uncharacterized protein n=1 Tax=Maritalea myrionectae TaxID=454601 RepID=A0A2R4MJ88_9HYPH|nr:hypothetical protein [Maritalea myrionectae]AVX06047.1 hypothetical protein MXMO3_03544 [Maritalea myrionectae]